MTHTIRSRHYLDADPSQHEPQTHLCAPNPGLGKRLGDVQGFSVNTCKLLFVLPDTLAQLECREFHQLLGLVRIESPAATLAGPGTDITPLNK